MKIDYGENIFKLSLEEIQKRLLTLLPFETLHHENKWYWVDLKDRELNLLVDSDQITSKRYSELLMQNAELKKTFCKHSYTNLQIDFDKESFDYVSFTELQVYTYESCEDCLMNINHQRMTFKRYDN
jgi:hypothetical protein